MNDKRNQFNKKIDEVITILDVVMIDYGLDDEADDYLIRAQKILEELKNETWAN